MLTSEKERSQTPSMPSIWSDGDRALQVCVCARVCVHMCTFAVSVAGADQTGCSPNSCNQSKETYENTHACMLARTHMHLHQ